MEFLIVVAVVGAAVYFGGAYMGYWKAPFVTPKSDE